MEAEELQRHYREDFQPYRDANWTNWRDDYLQIISETNDVDYKEFSKPEFQKRLWEKNPVTGIGSGSSVTVDGAYTDSEIVRLLWQLKTEVPRIQKSNRGEYLHKIFSTVLKLTRERHSNLGKNPTARLLRVFAALSPNNVLCIVSSPWLKRLKDEIGDNSRKQEMLQDHVRIQSFLREALQVDESLQASVDINQFAWWLAVQNQKKDEEASGGRVTSDGIDTATEIPSLSILPVAAQRKGLFYVTNNIPLLRSLVESSADGASRNELVEMILEERGDLNAKSAAMVVNQAKYLGLLKLENNTYRLTKRGEDLRDDEPLHNIFTPVMVRRVFGFAHLLDVVRKGGWVIEKKTLLRHMQDRYPSWTTSFAPSSLLSWGVNLGLLKSSQGAGSTIDVSATEEGQFWASGIPEDLTDWYVLENDTPEPEDEMENAKEVFPDREMSLVDFDKISSNMPANLILQDGLLPSLHSALHAQQTKRFVLLTGLSGTGKTSLVRAYAVSYCKALNLDAKIHYKEIPVLPDWTDPTGLLGYVNPLHENTTYQRTDALEFLLAAARNPDKPFFMCLDEMNLARVEYYFAPFLSAMESMKGSQKLVLHGFGEAVDNIPCYIPWPKNLFIFGTVNMDETTHPFSDKVLDRAFTFELWEVHKERWYASVKGSVSEAVLEGAYATLSELHDALMPVRRHFGYRVFDEVTNFCVAWHDQENVTQALDAAVYAKVLPRIRGEDTEAFTAALEKIEKICAARDLTKCAEKIRSMQEELAFAGITRFWL